MDRCGGQQRRQEVVGHNGGVERLRNRGDLRHVRQATGEADIRAHELRPTRGQQFAELPDRVQAFAVREGCVDPLGDLCLRLDGDSPTPTRGSPDSPASPTVPCPSTPRTPRNPPTTPSPAYLPGDSRDGRGRYHAGHGSRERPLSRRSTLIYRGWTARRVRRAGMDGTAPTRTHHPDWAHLPSRTTGSRAPCAPPLHRECR